MTGIAGVWHLDGRPLPRALLGDIGRALAHRGEDGEGQWSEPSIGLCCRLSRITPESASERQPVVGSAVLVFDGRLDNREDLLATLDGDPAARPGVPDSTLVLAAYRRFRERFVERLGGDFALGLFDVSRRRLLLARDPLGVRPLYYHHTPRSLAFASEIKALLADPDIVIRPDDEHLARFFLDDIRGRDGSTFFAGIRSVPPSTIVTISPAAVTTSRYWDFDPAARIEVRSFADAAAGFQHHFERAVRRRLRSAHPVAVSVSGGLDSSSIFCLASRLAARQAAPPVLGVAYTPPAGSPADERAFLDEIERRHGMVIRRLPMEPMTVQDGYRESVWHVEAPFADEHSATTAALHDAVRGAGCRVLLSGHWGDQMLFDQAYLVDLVHRLACRRAVSELREYGRWFTDADPRWYRRRFVADLAKYSLPGRLLPVLRRVRPRSTPSWYGRRLTERRRPWPAYDAGWGCGAATAHARSLYEQARSSYHVLCMEWHSKVGAARGVEPAFPFLDRDLLAFLVALPGEMVTWQGVPKALLRHAMRGVLPDPIVARRWKADFTSLVNEGMERNFAQTARIVRDGLAVRLGYLDTEALARNLEPVRLGLGGADARAAWSLSDLLGLELWLQTFFDPDRRTGDGVRGRDKDHEIVAATATEEAVPIAPSDDPR